jgi:hypothetical protein
MVSRWLGMREMQARRIRAQEGRPMSANREPLVLLCERDRYLETNAATVPARLR